MKLELTPHDAWRVYIVLHQPPESQQQHEKKQVVVTGKKCDTENYHCRNQGTGDRNELHCAAYNTENDRVGYAQEKQHDGINHKRQSGQDKLRTNISGEHHVEILNDAAQKLTLPASLRSSNNRISELTSVTQEEDGQDRYDDQPNGIRQQHGCATTKITRPRNDSPAVCREELLYTRLRLKAPPVLSPKLSDDPARRHLVQQARQSRRKLSTFICHARTDA